MVCRVHGALFTKGTRYTISEKVHTVLQVLKKYDLKKNNENKRMIGLTL